MKFMLATGICSLVVFATVAAAGGYHFAQARALAAEKAKTIAALACFVISAAAETMKITFLFAVVGKSALPATLIKRVACSV